VLEAAEDGSERDVNLAVGKAIMQFSDYYAESKSDLQPRCSYSIVIGKDPNYEPFHWEGKGRHTASQYIA
jgi:hypothetical protein